MEKAIKDFKQILNYLILSFGNKSYHTETVGVYLISKIQNVF